MKLKNKKTILSIAAGVAVFLAVFAWLFWGSIIPSPGGAKKKGPDSVPKVTNTTISRSEQGKKIWEFTVGEAVSTDGGTTIDFKDIKGKIFLKDGDVMTVTAKKGSAQLKNNDFMLEDGVNAVLEKGGSLRAQKITWKQKDDVLTAWGDVKVVHEEMMAKADKIITGTKLVHFILQGHSVLEKGGQYDED